MIEKRHPRVAFFFAEFFFLQLPLRPSFPLFGICDVSHIVICPRIPLVGFALQSFRSLRRNIVTTIVVDVYQLTGVLNEGIVMERTGLSCAGIIFRVRDAE